MTGRILVADIKLAVCVGFGVSPDSMTSPTRRAIFARPRQVAMYLTRKHTRLSLPQIGEKFGGRDHTTVIHACRRIEALRASDPAIDAAIRGCEAELAA